jgi:hypothetical protein
MPYLGFVKYICNHRRPKFTVSESTSSDVELSCGSLVRDYVEMCHQNLGTVRIGDINGMIRFF